MTYSPAAHRDLHPDLREASQRAFAIGQAVRLRDGLGRLVPPGTIYRITASLPARGGLPQYRIRNQDERHERMVTEDSLQLADVLAKNDSATLIERTFGRG